MKEIKPFKAFSDLGDGDYSHIILLFDIDEDGARTQAEHELRKPGRGAYYHRWIADGRLIGRVNGSGTMIGEPVKGELK